MSQATLKSLIASKIAERDEKIQPARTQNLNEVGSTLSDYNLFFSGIRSAVGVLCEPGSENIQLIDKVIEANEAELNTIERRIEVRKLLSENDAPAA
jgi:hypothetical protein